MRHQLRVGGVMLSYVVPWGGLTWSHDVYGCQEASWGASFGLRDRNPLMKVGTLVEILDGPAVVWSGEMAEPDWRGGEFTAMGLAYGAERFEALDGAGNGSATPSTATDQAIIRGWNLAGRSGVPTTPYVAAVDGPSTCGALFDINADELAQWWTVRADRVLRFQSAATTPRWYLRAGVIDLGNTDTGYASAVAVRYLDSATSLYKTAIRTDTLAAARFGYRESPINATGLGAISTTKANAIGDGLLAKGRSRLGWTQGVEVTPWDLRTRGGVPGDLSLVESHHIIRIPGSFEDLQFLGGVSYLDVPIGATGYTSGAGSMTISPLGAASQTMADVFADLYEAAAGKSAA